MRRPFFMFSVLAALWLHIWAVAGSLYPTKPVSSTIYEAGLPAEVRWMEDGKTPLLNLTGNLNIDLYAGRNTYLATIGKGIDPLSLSTTVFIPSNVPTNYHLYTLHFITVEPHQTIYTADFNIIQSPFVRPVSSLVASSSSAAVVTVTSTFLSRIAGVTTAQPSATQKSSASVGTSWNWALGRRGKPRGRFTMDMDKTRFRLMFIVWPALVGFSMAL